MSYLENANLTDKERQLLEKFDVEKFIKEMGISTDIPTEEQFNAAPQKMPAKLLARFRFQLDSEASTAYALPTVESFRVGDVFEGKDGEGFTRPMHIQIANITPDEVVYHYVREYEDKPYAVMSKMVGPDGNAIAIFETSQDGNAIPVFDCGTTHEELCKWHKIMSECSMQVHVPLEVFKNLYIDQNSIPK